MDLRPDRLGPFDVLLLMGPDGKAGRVVTSPTHDVSSCIGADLANAKLPPAPGPDWWVRISMGAKKKGPETR